MAQGSHTRGTNGPFAMSQGHPYYCARYCFVRIAVGFHFVPTSTMHSSSNDRENIRVLVADTALLTGRLIAAILRRDRALAVTETGAGSVLTTATTLTPHVVIIGEQRQDAHDGFEILKELRLAVPNTRIIVLLDCRDRNLVVEAFRSGARGVFCRNDSLKLLTRCVRKVHEGQIWVRGPELECLLETLAEAPATRLVDIQGATLLSKREQDVVRFLAEGFTNQEIATELKLSHNTIKNYMFRIFNKLGVSNRVEVVAYAASQRAAAVPDES